VRFQNTSGTVTLTKVGSGVQTLGVPSTYGGATNIQNGTLALGTSSGAVGRPTAGRHGAHVWAAAGGGGVFQLGDAGNAVNQTLTNLVISGTAGTANAVVGGNASTSTLTINDSVDIAYTGTFGGGRRQPEHAGPDEDRWRQADAPRRLTRTRAGQTSTAATVNFAALNNLGHRHGAELRRWHVAICQRQLWISAR